MSIYTASSEETLHARTLLKDWAAEGLLTEPQYQQLQKETVSELRTTNVYLRVILFLFTLVSLAAAAALFMIAFGEHPSHQTASILFFVYAAVCYAGAEIAVARARLYRYGIEEALAVCAVACLCAGMEVAFPGGPETLAPAAGAMLSLWLWRRFGLWYALPAAMIFVPFLVAGCTSSLPAQHVIVAGLYAFGLVLIAVAGSRQRIDPGHPYALGEAFLWIGIYLAMNLKLSSFSVPVYWLRGGTQAASAFSTPFYWTTWVLIWCLPLLVLVRGIRQKQRFVIASGILVAILTLVTNKPYLGWQRHTWDPMLLGLLLAGISLATRRWLAAGPGGVRQGFTAGRPTQKDKQRMNAGAAVLGWIAPQTIMPATDTNSAALHPGGGTSGGGGATGEF